MLVRVARGPAGPQGCPWVLPRRVLQQRWFLVRVAQRFSDSVKTTLLSAPRVARPRAGAAHPFHCVQRPTGRVEGDFPSTRWWTLGCFQINLPRALLYVAFAEHTHVFCGRSAGLVLPLLDRRLAGMGPPPPTAHTAAGARPSTWAARAAGCEHRLPVGLFSCENGTCGNTDLKSTAG